MIIKTNHSINLLNKIRKPPILSLIHKLKIIRINIGITNSKHKNNNTNNCILTK